MELVKEIFLWWCSSWNFLSGIMSVVALAGTIYNAQRNKLGFIFWLISNLYMSVRFCVIGEYAQSILFLIYFILALKGIAVWSKKDKQDVKNKRTAERVEEYIAKYDDNYNL